MSTGPDIGQTPGRLRATYRSADEAWEAVRRLEGVGLAGDDISVGDVDDRQHMVVHQQRSESDKTLMSPVAIFTPAQAKGATLWGLIGIVVGAVVLGVVGLFVTLGDLERFMSVIVWAFIGALAFGSAGFVYGGGRQPEVDGEITKASAEVTIAVQPHDAEAARRAIEVIETSNPCDAEYETYRGDPVVATYEEAQGSPSRLRRVRARIAPRP